MSMHDSTNPKGVLLRVHRDERASTQLKQRKDVLAVSLIAMPLVTIPFPLNAEPVTLKERVRIFANVFKRAESASAVVGALGPSETANVQQESGSWHAIQWDGGQAFVSKRATGRAENSATDRRAPPHAGAPDTDTTYAHFISVGQCNSALLQLACGALEARQNSVNPNQTKFLRTRLVT